MNAFAILAVNAHLQDLLDEATANRLVMADQPSIRERIASAASSVKATLQTPADYSKSIIPTIEDYPYRS